MQKIGLIITLGTRELESLKNNLVKVLGEELTSKVGRTSRQDEKKIIVSPRIGGTILLEHFNKIKTYLELPIVEPALSYFLEKYTDASLKKIVIICTDQDPDVGSFFYNNDTIHFATILSRLIPMKLADEYGIKQKEYSIDIISVQESVSFIDNMYQFWKGQLDTSLFKELKDFDIIGLSNQAGIPALKTAMLLQSLLYFGPSLRLIGVDENSNTALPLAFPQQYLFDIEKERVKTLIQQYNYAPLLEMNIAPAIQRWASYAKARLSFDFEVALHLVQDFTSNDITREKQIQLIKETKLLTQEKGLLQELYCNARIKYAQSAYADFLVRFVRIIEEFAKSKAITHLGDIDFKHTTWKEDIDEFLTQPKNEALNTFLKTKKVKGRGLKLYKPSIPVFMAIIEFNKDKEPGVYEFLCKVHPLTDLRNQSIGAHAFEPVSKLIIEKTLSGQNISILEVFNFLDDQLVPFKENIFDSINQQILKLLASP